MARQAIKPKAKVKAKASSPARPRPAKAAGKGTRPAPRTSKPPAKAKTAAATAAGGSKAKPPSRAKAPAKVKKAIAAKPEVKAEAARPGRKKKQEAEKPAAPVRMRPPWVPPKPPPPRRPAKRVHFDAKTLASIKAGLIEQREELTVQLKDIEEQAFLGTQSEMSGEVGYDEDYADAGTATFERERDLSLANNVQDLLDKINKALGKIDEGTYGVCESCGEPISGDRLKALPHVLMCIRCKQQEERR